jgi:DNA-binding PadR family transcriptional regulator
MKPKTQDQTTQNWMKEAQKGYIRMGVLMLLNKKPSHGYELMKEINSRTKGFWQPTAGGVYPILRDLEKSGYIKGHWETQKNRHLKIYKTTQSGDAILKHAIVKQSEIFTNISGLFNEFAREVLNVQTTAKMPMPSPFSAFLEDKNCEIALPQLEQQRTHIIENMKSMRERLADIDERIAQLKKQAKPNSEATSK